MSSCHKALARGGSRGGDWGDNPPKTYESNFFHHDFVQIRKTLDCQLRLDCQILLKSPPPNLTGWTRPWLSLWFAQVRSVKNVKVPATQIGLHNCITFKNKSLTNSNKLIHIVTLRHNSNILHWWYLSLIVGAYFLWD